MSLVGVDGFRLSKKTIKLEQSKTAEQKKKDDLKVIIPAKSLLEFAKIIADEADAKDVVSIYHLKDKNQVLLRVCDVTLSSRLLEGEFPDYQQIIPSEKNTSFVITKENLDKSVKIATIFARNVIGNKTIFKVDVDKKKLELSAKVQDIGNNESQAVLEEVEGEDYETAFNAKFLNDMLNAISGKTIIFESNGITAPGVFKDSKDKDYLHIIMPMRIE
jgi:DNA polymerase-3 subunit beta